jgi:hypothetical protein
VAGGELPPGEAGPLVGYRAGLPGVLEAAVPLTTRLYEHMFVIVVRQGDTDYYRSGPMNLVRDMTLPSFGWRTTSRNRTSADSNPIARPDHWQLGRRQGRSSTPSGSMLGLVSSTHPISRHVEHMPRVYP